ncbi:MAG: efflux RND transporter permease subunit [Chloroflexi bacterium]|nr:efflux RND transporter permease subunit [Chloroflexota bacterium]
MALTRLAITRPLAILMLVVGLVILGAMSYRQLRVDRLPRLNVGFVSVSVAWSGASPTDVEELIVKPLEGAISGVAGVVSINSTASSGRAMVSAQLAEGVDADKTAVEIERRVAAIRGRLPADAGIPVVNRADPNAFPVMNIAVTGNRPLDQLYDLTVNVIQPRLQSVLGVADVQVIGGLQKEVQVQVDVNKLAAYGLTLQQLQAAITRENLNQPAGTLIEDNRSVAVRSIGQYQSLADLGNVIVSSGAGNAAGTPGIPLRAVATIREDYKERTRIQRLSGAEAIGISIIKQSDANSLQVAHDLKDQLTALQKLLPSDVRLRITNDASRFTEASLNAVQFDLGLAVLLCALVLLLFLHSWRNVLIVVLAIPTSLISTFIVMYAFDLSLDTVSLMALALSIGILVDDSIVVIENINRHLKLGEGPLIAALNGRNEIGLAAMAITFVDVIVYLPMVFVSGFLGQLFREYGITIAIATLFSLFISFTLTPMLASRLLGAHVPGRPNLFARFGEWFDRGWDRLARGYGRALQASLRVRLLVLLVAALALAGAFSLVRFGLIGQEYAPTDDDNQFTVSIFMPQGSSLAATDATAQQVEAMIRQVPEVEEVFTSVGVGFGGGGSATITVQLKDKRQRSRSVFEVIAELRDKGRQITAQTRANLNFRVENPLGSGGFGGGGANTISVRLLGDDYATMLQTATTLVEFLKSVPGVAEARVNQTAGDPEIRAVANRSRMADFGISQQTVATSLRIALAGVQVGALRPEGELQRDITLIAQPADRQNLQALANLPIPTGSGNFTRLSQVADLVRATSPSTINRQDRQRTITLSVTPSGPVGQVAEALRNALATYPLPEGYQTIVGGTAATLDQAFGQLVAALWLSVLLIYMLMVALYESWLQPFVIMFSVPVALVGAFLGLWLTGNTLNIFSMLGILMLLGLVAKNGILLVDYTNTLRARGLTRLPAVLEAAPTRLKPIVMTSATVVMAMIPLALKLESGAESRAPLAVVVIGGVLSSTLLTLFLVPTVYTYVDSLSERVATLFRPRAAALAPGGGAAEGTPVLATANGPRPRRWFRR